MSELFYRFQKTNELEHESYSEFLSDIFFTIGGEENEWEILDFDEKEEYIEEIYRKWSFAIDSWWDKHRKQFENEDFDDEIEYLITLLSKQTEKSLWSFMMKYKLNGVFALKTNDFPDKMHLFELSRNPELGLHNNYLLIIEGNNLEYFGPEYGYLINPIRIVSVENVPSQYVKQ